MTKKRKSKGENKKKGRVNYEKMERTRRKERVKVKERKAE